MPCRNARLGLPAWARGRTRPRSDVRVLARPADRAGDLAHRPRTRRRRQELPGARERRLDRVTRQEPAEHVVAGREALRPRRRELEPLPELGSDRARQVVDLEGRVPKLARRHPEERAAADRRQLEGDALGAAVMGDQGRRRLQAADHGPVLARGLRGIGLRDHVDRRADADDERQMAGGQPPVQAGREAFEPVADVAVEKRRQRRSRSSRQPFGLRLSHLAIVRLRELGYARVA